MAKDDKNNKKETIRELNEPIDAILKSEEASSNIEGQLPDIPKRPPKNRDKDGN